MSDRDTEPKKPAPARFPTFFSRTRAMSSSGSSGWEATSIGFTLVGCIGACSALGYWLDNHFGTKIWLPILFLVGVVAGFREMFLVLGRITRKEQAKKAKKQGQVRLAPMPASPDQAPPEPMARERIFKVPPPPMGGQSTENQKIESSGSKEPESVDELIERLLRDGSDEGSDSENDQKKRDSGAK